MLSLRILDMGDQEGLRRCLDRADHAPERPDPQSLDALPHALMLEALAAWTDAGDATAMAAYDGDTLGGYCVYREPSWDHEHFGYPVGRIECLVGADGQALSALASWADEQARSHGVVFASARLPLDGLLAIAALEDEGFRFMEVMRHPWYTLSQVTRPDTAVSRPLRQSDRGAVQRLASRAYSADRFHRDPRFSRRAADGVYERWAGAWFEEWTEQRGGTVIERDGRLLGYVLFELRRQRPFGLADVCRIGLSAVDPASAGQGLGTALYAETLNAVRDQVPYVVGSCSLSNLPIMALHRRLGGRYYSSEEVTLHRWYS